MQEALLLPRTLGRRGLASEALPSGRTGARDPPGEPDGASTEPASQSLSFVFLSSGTSFKLWPRLSPLPGSPDAQGPSGDALREKEGQTPGADTRPRSPCPAPESRSADPAPGPDLTGAGGRSVGAASPRGPCGGVPRSLQDSGQQLSSGPALHPGERF